MTDEQNTRRDALISSGERGLITPQSAGLARRGLDLLTTLRERLVCFPPNTSVGFLEMRDIGDPHPFGESLGVAEGIIKIPIGKELILKVTNLDLAPLGALQSGSAAEFVVCDQRFRARVVR